MSEITPLNFAEFAAQPEYVAVNEQLVRLALSHLPRPFTSVDVATGTGMFPKIADEIIFAEHIPWNTHPSLIIGIDPNPTSLEIARKTTTIHPRLNVLYLGGKGQDAFEIAGPHLPGFGADLASIHDAIHEIPELEQKQAVLAAMTRVLRPGGILTLNSAFTSIAMDDHSAMDWGKLKAAAMKHCGQRRDKSVPMLPILKPEDYKQMLLDLGLQITHEQITEVVLTKASIAAICRYPPFITGMLADMANLSSYSMEELSQGLVQTLDEFTGGDQTKTFSRNWWEVIAQKRA